MKRQRLRKLCPGAYLLRCNGRSFRIWCERKRRPGQPDLETWIAATVRGKRLSFFTPVKSKAHALRIAPDLARQYEIV